MIWLAHQYVQIVKEQAISMLNITFMNEQIDYIYDRNTNLTFRYFNIFHSFPSSSDIKGHIFQDLVFSADFATHYI